MIPYGLPLIYSTFACDSAPSTRLFLFASLAPVLGATLRNEAPIMTTKTLNTSDLAQFTGSENWYRHGINRNVLYTDGAQHVAEHGGAYWLLDEIAIIQPYNQHVAAEGFQVWKLAVHPDRTATLTCDDGNGNIVFTKNIEHTDFPRMKSRCTSPTTSSTCRASTDQCEARAGVLAGARVIGLFRSNTKLRPEQPQATEGTPRHCNVGLCALFSSTEGGLWKERL